MLAKAVLVSAWRERANSAGEIAMSEARRLLEEQIEERRKNLAFIRENAALLENGDYLFTTTLLMQEQWLAIVDALRARERELVAALGKIRAECAGWLTSGIAQQEGVPGHVITEWETVARDAIEENEL